MTNTWAPPAERLARRLVVRDSGCIEWTGFTSRKGYGQIHVNHRMIETHLLAWELANGPIPDGLFVYRTCDNRPCCNVEHLWLGTRLEKPVSLSTEDRLGSHVVEMPNGCLEWTGTTGRGGYGRTNLKGKSFGSHRLAWELANGPIPPGLFVLHRCDNPPCCNVEHLFLGTHAENMADMVTKRRSRSGQGPQRATDTHCANGHKFDEASTYVCLGRKKACRICNRESAARSKAARTLAQPGLDFGDAS